jgi:hypothetical protein
MAIVVELCWKAWPMPLATPGEQGIGQQLALLRYQPSAHAGLAVLAGDIALERDIDRIAVTRDAGQRLGADVGAFGTDVAVAGADHEAFLDPRADMIGQDGVVHQAQQHRLRVTLRLAAGGGIETAEEEGAGEGTAGDVAAGVTWWSGLRGVSGRFEGLDRCPVAEGDADDSGGRKRRAADSRRWRHGGRTQGR